MYQRKPSFKQRLPGLFCGDPGQRLESLSEPLASGANWHKADVAHPNHFVRSKHGWAQNGDGQNEHCGGISWNMFESFNDASVARTLNGGDTKSGRVRGCLAVSSNGGTLGSCPWLARRRFQKAALACQLS